MLEDLFAHARQEQTFLALTVCGVILGAAVHMATFLGRRNRILGAVAEVFSAALLGAMLLAVLLRSGSGLRGYGALGLVIGLTLYTAGLGRLVSGAAGLWARAQKTLRQKKEFPAGTGKSL